MKVAPWIPIGIAVLFVLHQDFWWWDAIGLNATESSRGDPVFGFLPIGLAYHIGFSLAAASFWALVVWKGWPKDSE